MFYSFIALGKLNNLGKSYNLKVVVICPIYGTSGLE